MVGVLAVLIERKGVVRVRFHNPALRQRAGGLRTADGRPR
jgi:hypothetical protein